MLAAKKMMRLFPGLARTHGQFNPTNNTHKFVHEDLTIQHYIDHIEGRAALGIVPINEDNKVQSGSLDIDDHKKDKTKNPEPWSLEQYKKLTDKIKFLKLPLTVFKSKSGGAHCHLFLDDWVSAKLVQDLMNVFQYALGYEGLEIFPKQTILKPTDNGSFINLPYFNGNSRVCINFDNEELNLDEGLNYSIKRTVRLKNCLKFFLLKQGSRTQHRNDRTWCAAAFFKKQYPGEWEQKTKEYNQLFNEPPLEEKELEKTVFKSHRNKEYNKQEDNQEEPPQNFWEGFNEPGTTEHESGNNKTDPSAWRHGILAKDLEQEELKPVQWVVEGLIAPGLNLIAGKSKIGKSWLVLWLSYAVEKGLEVLGFKCAKGSVLHYSLEDGKIRTKNRWKVMGIKPQETNYQFRTRKPKIPLLTMGLEEEIEDWIKNTQDAKLVVIDVYVKVKKTLGGYKLNSYENDNYNLQDLQTLATKYEIAIVLVHHLKKLRADDVFDEITGSAGIQSNMDSMIVISSDRKKTKNPILNCIPKDAEQQEFEISLNPKCIWENLGKPGMAALTNIQNSIIKIMKDDKERSAKEIIINVQESCKSENWGDEHIRTEITRLTEKSHLMKMKRGIYKQVPF